MFNRHRHALLRESALVFGWLLATLLFITLLSYAPDDPAWSFIGDETPDSGETHNRLGIVGAHIADILLSAFGYSAYLLCIVALLALHALIYPLARVDGDKLGAHWCAVGLLIFILSSAALENIRFAAYAQSLPSGAGGGAGALIADGILGLFGMTGACAILLFFWMISWSLAANLSWFAFFELIGEIIEKIGCMMWTKIRHIQVGIAAKRARQQIEFNTPPIHHEPQFNLTARTRTPVPVAAPIRLSSPPPSTSVGDDIRVNVDVNNDVQDDESPGATLPSLALLDVYESTVRGVSAEILTHNSQLIQDTLGSFGVAVKVLSTHPGPVITRYDIQPDAGVKGAQIVSLVRDMARALSVSGIRVLETIPGKNCMGLEIPNQHRATVYLSDLIADDSYVHGGHILPLAIGKDATGKPLTADLAKMPHLLVAGATGSGKSVCINAMLLSLLFALPPERLRLILIDPKMLELASYHNIPHLLAQVVTDVSLAPAALNWAVEEMENRYRLMSSSGARNIDSYNQKIAAADSPGRPLPYIVIVIDELADLMMTTGKKVEITISRLTQKARAAGIHLILATQRPSVDVITGLIKANVPCRIAFQVASKVDSRTIIDQMGADMLLGMGDMLYLPPGTAAPRRVHGAFVDDDEVRRVAEHLRAGQQSEDMLDFAAEAITDTALDDTPHGEEDVLYAQAIEAIMASNRPSISLVQRKLRIGYNRAARMIETMESAGIVSPIDETGVRKILVQRPPN